MNAEIADIRANWIRRHDSGTTYYIHKRHNAEIVRLASGDCRWIVNFNLGGSREYRGLYTAMLAGNWGN